MEIPRIQEFNGHDIFAITHTTDSKDMVVYCHGYNGTASGSGRLPVRLARLLATHDIGTVRFEQYGSGNSAGDFIDSSFDDWVATTQSIASHYLSEGYRVALLGNSMGGSTAIVAGSRMPEITAVAAIVPDANVGDFIAPADGLWRENGSVVKASFWQEAYDAKVAERLPLITAPTFILQCSNDQIVDQASRDAITKSARPDQTVEILEGFSHYGWDENQSQIIIQKLAAFLTHSFLG
jgi:alpha-beta hydrolase superfamily lysophospholipase